SPLPTKNRMPFFYVVKFLLDSARGIPQTGCMKGEIEQLVEMVRLTRLRVIGLKELRRNNHIATDALDDADMALGWTIRRLELVRDTLESHNGESSKLN